MLPLIWWLLGSVAPGLLNATPNDPTALVLIKLPATLADLGIAAIVGWALRDRPSWAVVAVLGVLLHPAIAYVSGLWAQFESVYVLPMLIAWLLAARGRPGWAAVAVAVSLMTKPQALPLIVPFAAWFLATGGWRGAVRAAAIGLATIAVLWVPFVAASGPTKYLGNLADYSSLFAVLSLRAWNPWWILQSLAGGGDFVADSTAIIGPVTFRWLGIAIAGTLELLVFLWVWRRPDARTLAWGLAAAGLVAFVGLTEMHERYAYPALIFLLVLFPDRRAVALWVTLGIVYTLNLVAAVPPTPAIGAVIPVDGWLGIAGSVVMTAVMIGTLIGLRTSPSSPLARSSPSVPEPGSDRA
ncbi:MAG: glycosyltransferase 87 family protein [Chloroflexota bacterium]